jgi:hypothetical protein
MNLPLLSKYYIFVMVSGCGENFPAQQEFVTAGVGMGSYPLTGNFSLTSLVAINDRSYDMYETRMDMEY